MYAGARAERKTLENGADYCFNIADTALYNGINVLDQFIDYSLSDVENWLSSLITFIHRTIKITPLKII